MFPLKDSVPAKHPPITLWIVIGLNCAAFLWQNAVALGNEDYPSWLGLAVVPSLVSWSEPPSWVPLFTSQFLHGGFVHLISNLWMLWIFGDNVEDRMGPVRFGIFYLLCGVLAGITHIAFDPSSPVPTIGASGAIAGVLGAYLLLYPHARVLTLVPVFFLPLVFDVPAVVFLVLWFGLQVLNGSLSLLTSDALHSVAWWAHIGGFIAGIALCRPFARRRLHPRALQLDEWTLEDLWRRMR
ncbi:MAG: rhomboid family intramembrane serine protease [Planctomycetes bacterium]|nr:rhomboid family intramembrane serine protease [Planctomycetota bacterium]